MALILAIDPDKRQSTQLASLVRAQLQAELVQRPTAAEGLEAIDGRVPDLVLTSPLISPREDARLAAHLRELGAAATHVQTVTIPLLGAAAPARARGGMLSALRREKPQTAMTDGCAPEVFADQIRQYLATAEDQRCAALDACLMPAVSEACDDFETPAELDTLSECETATEYEASAGDEWPVEYEAPATLIEPEAVLRAPAALTLEPAATDDEFGAEAPGLPLAQLLEMVSSWSPREEEPLWPDVAADVVEPAAARAVTSEAHAAVSEEVAEGVAEEVSEEIPEEIPEEMLSLELLQDAGTDHSVVPVVELPAGAIADDALVGLEDLFAAPVEAAPPIAEDFTELYVDPAVASALDALSLHVPARSLADGIPAEAPIPVIEFHSFENLDSIANELAAAPARPAFEPLDDLAGLFAAPPAYHAPATAESPGPAPVGKNLFQSLFAEPAGEFPMASEVEVPGVDPSLFAAPEPVFAATAMSIAAPEIGAAPEIAPERTEPVVEFVMEPAEEPLVELASLPPVWAEPAVPALADVPVAVEPVAEWFAAPAAAVDDAVVEPLAAEWFTAAEAVADEPTLTEPLNAVTTEAVTTEAVTPVTPIMPVVEAAAPEPTVAVAEEAQPFSFTFVDGFGDELRDFEMTPDAAVTDAPEDSESAPFEPALPILDDEALSLIGDAARKASLDALVIEEFERGLGPRRPARKPKPKRAHAGATQIVPPVDRLARKKAPVDEWGMFDPEQCGFAALDDDDALPDARPVRDGSRSRIIPY